MQIKQLHRAAFCVAILLVISHHTAAQVPTPPSLKEILDRAASERSRYVDEFKNLISEERKNLIVYDKNNNVKKQRSIVSTFIVYQIGEGEQGIVEFRNVRSVDGKPVENPDQRSQDFLNEIAQLKNSGKGLSKIEKEGSRYDEGLSVNGMTLFKAPILADNLRPLFEFALDGMDHVDGRNVYTVTYRQVKESPYISTRPSGAVNDGKMALIYDIGVEDSKTARVGGRIWIDRETFQVVKESRNLTIDPKNSSTPVAAAESVLEYGESAFGILTPRRITFTRFRSPRPGEPDRKDAAVVLEYGKFARANVEVKVVDSND